MSVEAGPLPFNEVHNGARILLLLRTVKTWRDLCACFGVPSDMKDTGTKTLYDQLATLRKLGLVEFDADTAERCAIDQQIAVSMHWTEVQNALGHQTLSDIADISSWGSGVVVHPVFGRPAKREHPAQVFMLMPFKTELKDIYEKHIKALAKQLEITVVRADERYALGKAFINTIWDGIFGAELIIADCTEKNANVFYEIGVAHTVGKPIVLITRSHEDIPSDIKHLDYIIYDTPQAVAILLEKLSEVLQRMVRAK